ncbi:DUF2267 domain-containing protein [Allokutzneria albata]|uniref:Uncharacterized conserved protein, DUF2267 family n=1 Tax=Allokutzneria albata TaxID=211114 RepID=A0A1G9SIZ9_ALLAB|nr:DUF2267 domain-containing protein [Allokutzneria albata]SDM35478.1 Uncharacterized conserved protein, DUF2267 family [Allokutzneria albata]
MAHQPDPFAPAHQKAQEWLSTIAHHLGTEDRHYAYRVLRAWLHLVRDRLTVDSAAHFAAQLPEVLCGVFYNGWAPSRGPVRYDVNWFTTAFAHSADISPAEVPAAAGAVSAGLKALCSPGQLNHVFALMPASLRGELEGEAATPQTPPPASAERRRLDALEDNVEALIEAVGVLARGLEQLPTSEASADRTAKSGQEAHRILLAHTTGRAEC